MLILALLIIVAAVVAMVRRVEVRLVLLAAGLAMALLAGKPLTVTDTFTKAMITAMVAPICAAMGFAALMTATGCDKHLVHLLLAPVRRFRFLVLPGGILVAYLVNMAVPSQTSTAAALGPILVPLLMASGYSAAVSGAALILGASFGGDLLNPGAQDVQAIAGAVRLSAPDISALVIPASIGGAVVAALVFSVLNRTGNGPENGAALVHAPEENSTPFRLNVGKAVIPLVPIALLLLGYAGFPGLRWLIAPPAGDEWKPLANALPVVRAMLIGALLSVLVVFREIQQLTKGFFEGMGLAYGSIISLTITAQVFGAGIAAIGLAEALLAGARATGALTLLSVAFPWGLSTLSGSGSGPILAFAQAFLTQLEPGAETVKLAALSCFGGAFGRTMSPVSAVVVYSSGLVGISPVVLIRRFLPALLAGGAVAIALALR